MTAQQFVETVAEYDRRLRHYLALQAWLQEQLEECDDTSLGWQTRATLASRSQELSQGIEDAYQALAQQKRKVRHLIDRLPDRDERQALTLRFVDLMPHQKAAEAMYISERHLYRIQKKALMHLEGLFHTS